MYCQKQPTNQSNLFHVVREQKVSRQEPEEVELFDKVKSFGDEDEPIIVKPKRVKQRLPGVKLLRQLHRSD